MHRAEEDYLKVIYELTYEHNVELVKTNQIAQRLNITDQSVNEMIKKLEVKKLVVYYPYKGIGLTKSGFDKAVRLIRAHRLWEVFLTKKLGFSWQNVHDDAENLEHATSTKVIDALDAYLGYPKFCQHGNPIPDAKGVILQQHHQSLFDYEKHQELIITRVTDHKPLLDYLDKISLRLGDVIIIKDIDDFNGLMLIEKNGENIYLSFKNAQLIYAKTKSSNDK